MRFKNVSADVVRYNRPELGNVAVKPGDVVDVPMWACQPSRTPGGSRLPSIIERLAPQLQPEDARECAMWAAVPEPGAKLSNSSKRAALGDVSVPDLEELIKSGVSPAKARRMVSDAMAMKSIVEQEG